MNFESAKIRTEVNKVYVDCKTSDIRKIQEAVWLYGGTISIYYMYHQDGRDIYNMSYMLQTEKITFIIYGVEITATQYNNQLECWGEKTHKNFEPHSCLTLVDNSYFLPYEQD